MWVSLARSEMWERRVVRVSVEWGSPFVVEVIRRRAERAVERAERMVGGD